MAGPRTTTTTKNAKLANAFAIPLIGVENNEFYVNPEAIEFLQGIDTMGVIAAAGPYRTGKSFFLNKLLKCKKNTGFGVGSTSQACTKGLWLSLKTIDAVNPDTKEPFTCIVIDTEGIGSLDASSTHDTRIFCLALLLSSFFIYNSNGTIDENALSTLALVANMSEHVRVSSNQESKQSSEEQLGQYFPEFLWLVRNWALVRADENGNPITSKEYLELALRETVLPVDHKFSEADVAQRNEKNRLRSLLRSFFPKRDCTTLVRPSNDEKDLQNLDKKDEKDLRPEFVEQMNQLIQRITTTVRPKMVLGKPINGKLFGALCKSYVDAINKGAAPVIQDSWSMLCELQGKDAVEKALAEWSSTMNDFFKESKYYDPSELDEKCSSADSDAERLFKKLVMGQPEDTRPYREKLKAEMAKKRQDVKDINDRALVTFLQEKINDLDQKISKLGQRGEQACSLANMKALFDQVAVQSNSPSHKIWASMVLGKIWNWANLALGAADKALDDAEKANLMLKTVKRELDQLSESLNAVTQEKEKYRSLYNELFASHESTLASFGQERESFTDQLKEKTTHLKELMAEKVDLQAKIDSLVALQDSEKDTQRNELVLHAQVESLQGELESVMQKLSDANRDVTILSEKLNVCLQEQAEKAGLESTNVAVHLKEIESLKTELAESQQFFKTQLKNMEMNFQLAAQEGKQALHTEKESLQSTLNQKDRALKSMEEKNILLIKEYETRISQKEKELEKALTNLGELTLSMETLKSEHAALKKEISVLHSEHKTELKNCLDAKNVELKEKETWERDFVAKKSDEIRVILSEKKDLETAIRIAEINNESLKRRLEEFGDQPTAKKLKLDLDSSILESQKLNVKNDFLEKRIASQDRDLETLQAKNKALEKEIREMSRHHDLELTETRINYERKISAMQAQRG